MVRIHSDEAHRSGEFAILLRSDLKGRGLGWTLMQLMIDYAKSRGLSHIDGQILQENSVMLKMCRELGFKVETDAEDRGICNVPHDRRFIDRRATGDPDIMPSCGGRFGCLPARRVREPGRAMLVR